MLSSRTMHRLIGTLILVISTCVWAAPPQAGGSFTTSDGIRIHYLETGQGRAIVFIPGWTMAADIWQAQIDALSGKYRVIAMDPRSQGDSDKPVEGNYPARRARDVKELVDHLKLEKPVLVGWSMGVPELLSYVEQFGTDNIGGLVLVDGMVKIPAEMAATFPAFVNGFQVDRRKATDGFVKSMYAKPQRPEYLANVTEASLKTPTNSAMALMMGMLARPDWSAILPKLAAIPVQYHFEPYLQNQADIVKEKLPSAKIARYDDAGHALFVDDAERFNGALREMMDQTGPK